MREEPGAAGRKKSSISLQNNERLAMMTSAGTVYIVDDVPEVRDAISSLCRSAGFETVLFASTEEFSAELAPARPACLVLDVRFPGMAATGLQFQRILAESGMSIPIVFVTGYPDVKDAVESMKRGAIDYLTKPFREHELLDSIRRGMQQDVHRSQRETRLAEVRKRADSLTDREREIMLMTAEGLRVKQIAFKLSLSEITVKVHRARMMKKLGVTSSLEVGRFVDGMSAPAVAFDTPPRPASGAEDIDVAAAGAPYRRLQAIPQGAQACIGTRVELLKPRQRSGPGDLSGQTPERGGACRP